MSDEATRITQKPAREGEWAAEMRAQLEDMRGQVEAAVARAEDWKHRHDERQIEAEAAMTALTRLRGLLESDEGLRKANREAADWMEGAYEFLERVETWKGSDEDELSDLIATAPDSDALRAALDAILAAAGSDDGNA